MLKNRLNQAGDTIVEVLIAIAVISLVLVGAYTSTNNNIASTQDAQERTQAVKLVETQIEYLRKSGTIASGNCFNASGPQTAAGAQGGNPCIVVSDGSMANANVQPAYTLSIIPSPNPGVYVVAADWASIANRGRSNVTMYYQP